MIKVEVLAKTNDSEKILITCDNLKEVEDLIETLKIITQNIYVSEMSGYGATKE